ncbi:type II toxin-antitoxin system RelE/ParE family toxin [Obesumbacterium proteus]|uniref:type II toxin-antitoxin system RelE/ParE family toxin n=1 Tax=Obesumbacterium proteus TaxID=82983 RepID=UPI0007E31FD8|nr:type II toxin-antitoxin system RelE/ParE family toxin [Obesumbacterium proteus]
MLYHSSEVQKTTLTYNIVRFPNGAHMGRDYDAVPGVMRIEFQRHAIFYTVRDTDILIARILHQQMNHKRHLL